MGQLVTVIFNASDPCVITTIFVSYFYNFTYMASIYNFFCPEKKKNCKSKTCTNCDQYLIKDVAECWSLFQSEQV